MPLLRIEFESLVIKAELKNNNTGKAIMEMLPYEGRVKTWGHEIYFDFPLVVEEEDDALIELNKGDIAYWTEGQVLCLFFGPTPVSHNDNPVAIAPVNMFGQVLGDCDQLKNVRNNEKVIVSLLSD